MKKPLLLCALLAGLPAPTPAAAPEGSVVRVFATVRYPNPHKPWTNGTAGDVAGSGTVIDGKRLQSCPLPTYQDKPLSSGCLFLVVPFVPRPRSGHGAAVGRFVPGRFSLFIFAAQMPHPS
jgi:hypothetical protein